MTTVTWLPRDRTNPMPHQFGAADNGQVFVMVRERANGGGWRMSLFPDGKRDGAIERGGRLRGVGEAVDRTVGRKSDDQLPRAGAQAHAPRGRGQAPELQGL